MNYILSKSRCFGQGLHFFTDSIHGYKFGHFDVALKLLILERTRNSSHYVLQGMVQGHRFCCQSWAPAGFFPGVGKLGGLKTKVPEHGSGVELGEVWGKSPQKPAKKCENDA